jgi:hypothetical protein
MENSKFLFKFRVPSKSEPGTLRTAEIYSNGKVLCDCPAKDTLLCHHGKTIVETLKKVTEKIEANYKITT